MSRAQPGLSVLGVGLFLPPRVSVRQVAAGAGADVSGYGGWEQSCRAGEDDHPSTMGARALEDALAMAGVDPAELRLVIYSGASRDYVPSWSVSAEIMHRCGLADTCLGLDMTAGCLATLAALDLAHGWLGLHGGGCAAVVAAERWSQTIDHGDPSTVNLWSYGDSAGAVVVGLDVDRPPVLTYLGAEFRSASQNNGHVLVPYGGTRAPTAPAGVDPNARQVSDRPKKEITASYRAGYADAYAALQERFGLEPDRLVCNQTSPQLVGMLTTVLGMGDRALVTGHDTGHLGGPDVIVGLRRLIDAGLTEDVILMVASAAYVFGTGLLIKPGGGKDGSDGDE